MISSPCYGETVCNGNVTIMCDIVVMSEIICETSKQGRIELKTD